MGKNCAGSSRWIVQKGIRNDLLKRIVALARKEPMGDPLDPVNRRRAGVESALRQGLWFLKTGPKIVMGGKHDKGFSGRRSLKYPPMQDRRRTKSSAWSYRSSPLTASTRPSPVYPAKDNLGRLGRRRGRDRLLAASSVRQTPRHKGRAASSVILPGQPAPAPPPGDATVDPAIFGGSFAGLAAPATRPYGSGGTGSARCSPPRSGASGSRRCALAGCGSGTWTKALGG